MHGPINVKSPNNSSKWQMGFNLAFKGLNSNEVMTVGEVNAHYILSLVTHLLCQWRIQNITINHSVSSAVSIHWSLVYGLKFANHILNITPTNDSPLTFFFILDLN